VQKTALGAEDSLSWSIHRDGAALVARLVREGFYVLALETAEGAIPLGQLSLSGLDASKIVLVVGSEPAGVDPGILELARQVVRIPMRGRKGSLNAAVAFGVAAFAISEQLASVHNASV
jgi:tRNA G18 (ribose-2'-O)-methylase SpoU